MIKIENIEVTGFKTAIRGMRNPKNSWAKSDSDIELESWHDTSGGTFNIGPNDHELMTKLAKAGSVHAKYRRMIIIYMDITAPLYWWKEFDTYKVGTVANSCSTMHKIAAKEFTLDDFSHEHLFDNDANNVTLHANTPSEGNFDLETNPFGLLKLTIATLNAFRDAYLWCNTENKKEYWWQMIQLLPSSYNQRRTLLFNYENASEMHFYRHDHKQDEWRDFCKVLETLPYSELITVHKGENNNV